MMVTRSVTCSHEQLNDGHMTRTNNRGENVPYWLLIVYLKLLLQVSVMLEFSDELK